MTWVTVFYKDKKLNYIQTFEVNLIKINKEIDFF